MTDFEHDFDATLNGKTVYIILEGEADGYYDPGKPYGPLETSYPPEGELNVTYTVATIRHDDEDDRREKLEGHATIEAFLLKLEDTEDNLNKINEVAFQALSDADEAAYEDAQEARFDTMRDDGDWYPGKRH